MKIKFRSIELFGISGSGKTFIRKKIREKLAFNGYEVLDSREIIIKNIKFFVKTNFVENFQIRYFNFLLKFNIRTTLWNKSLDAIVNKYLKKRKKKFNLFMIKVKKLFNEKDLTKFNYYNIWIKELVVGTILSYDLIDFDKKIIFFPDEGFVQKIFFLNFINKKKKELLIKNFLNQKIFCDLIVNIKTEKKIIKKINQIRIRTKNGWILSESEINKMFLLEKKIKKKLLSKIKVLKNYKKIDYQINNLLNK